MQFLVKLNLGLKLNKSIQRNGSWDTIGATSF